MYTGKSQHIPAKEGILDSRKEDLQFAYLSALCASADIDIERKIHDNDSADAEIRKIMSINGERMRCIINIQLKCSASRNNCRISDEAVVYDLPVKNYDDLRLQGEPMLLMLLVLPENENAVLWTEEELLMKGTMYYKNLMGEKPVSNTETIAIKFSKTENIVDQSKLIWLLRKAAEGGFCDESR